MIIKAKFFNELNTSELYELLKVRAAVFIVEQNCVYQDLDDKDYESLHVYFEDDADAINSYRLKMIKTFR